LCVFSPHGPGALLYCPHPSPPPLPPSLSPPHRSRALEDKLQRELERLTAAARETDRQHTQLADQLQPIVLQADETRRKVEGAERTTRGLADQLERCVSLRLSVLCTCLCQSVYGCKPMRPEGKSKGLREPGDWLISERGVCACVSLSLSLSLSHLSSTTSRSATRRNSRPKSCVCLSVYAVYICVCLSRSLSLSL